MDPQTARGPTITTMIRKVGTYSFIIFAITFFSFDCYAETYQFENKFPDYLSASGLINSITCTIESNHLNKEIHLKKLIIEAVLENFIIDSGQDVFKFRLSRDNSLVFTLSESNVYLDSATYKNEVDHTEELEKNINKIVSSHNKRMKTQAKLVCSEIDKVWKFLGKSIEKKAPKSLFTIFYENRLSKVVYQEFGSAKLPVNYSEWSLDHHNEKIGYLELNIEYQKIGSVYIPYHFIVQYPNVSREPNQKGRRFDMRFYNCKTE